MKQLFTLLIFFTALLPEKISAQLNATITSLNPGCTVSTGSATITPTGGRNYTYKWSNGATTQSISGLSATTYTVTVYSGGGVGGTIYDTIYKETFDEANPA